MWISKATIYVCFGASLLPLYAADLSGIVLDSGSKPIRAARVRATSAAGGTVESLAALSGTDGSFSMKGLANRVWTLCVATDGEDLDPCEWAETSVTVVVDDKAPPKPVRLKLDRGIRLALRVDDEYNLLQTVGNPKGLAYLRPLIRIGKFDHAFTLVSSDHKGHNFEVVVPRSVEASLLLVPHGANLEIQKGQGGGNGTIQAVSGSPVLVPLGKTQGVVPRVVLVP